MGVSRFEIQRSWQLSSTREFLHASGELVVEVGKILVEVTKEFGPVLAKTLFGSSKAKQPAPAPAAPPLPRIPPPEERLYLWQYRPVWRWYLHQFVYSQRLNHPSVKNQEAWCGICGYRRYHSIHSIEVEQARLI